MKLLTCVLGIVFGDEGKGKIIDKLCGDYDIVVRYNGGPNAGHTVNVGGRDFKFHQIPCGGLVSNLPVLVLADGMVINPVTLVKEIKQLQHCIGFLKPRIMISAKAHCIMPWHINVDIRKSKKELGTTAQGVGPCYAEKANRKNAIRMGNLVERLKEEREGRYFSADIAMHGDNNWQSYFDAAIFLETYVTDTGKFLRSEISKGADVLFEGANSIGLDIDHGNYPFVTSSGCGPAAIPQYCALPNIKLDRIIGVSKCYCTRVGTGPMKTEIADVVLSSKIRDYGKEYGTTTGRPRRIGWLNLDEIKENIELTAASEIALTHCDTISRLSKDGINFIGVQFENFLHQVPVWTEPSLKNLQFVSFISMVEDFLKVPVSILGVGKERDAVIFRPTEEVRPETLQFSA